MARTIQKLTMSVCFVALWVLTGPTDDASGSEKAPQPAVQPAAGGSVATPREPSSPSGAENAGPAGRTSAEDSWDHPDQGLGWQWPVERDAGAERPPADASASPEGQRRPVTDPEERAEEISDHPDQGLGWQFPATDSPSAR